MPRKKTKPIRSLEIENQGDSVKINPENTLIYCEENIKQEPSDNEHEVGAKLDLNRFKYQKKVKIEFETDETPKEAKGLWEPPQWRMFLENLKMMRSNNDAPVDSMGCHMTMDENAPPQVIRYQTLISLMLSSQTKDQVTFAAMERLKERGLTVENVLALSDEELGKLIYPVGFWKIKVKYIKKTTETLKDQYNSDIPDSVEKLCKLTGVGPKMAHICMKVAWNKVTGIGVDTHVHRISNRNGWVKKTTAKPEDTRKALESWLPFDLWSEVNHLMVGFGQTICLPVGPTCDKCLNKNICPSSGKLKRSPNKKSPVKKNPEDIKICSKSKLQNELLISEQMPQFSEKENDLKPTVNTERSNNLAYNMLQSEIQAQHAVEQTAESDHCSNTVPASETMHFKRKSTPNKKQRDENDGALEKNKKNLRVKKKRT
ncbi:unnamed protein product, partial [Iphiclides podalirius]